MNAAIKTSDLFKISLVLRFASTAGIILSNTYIDLLFLSTYPKGWLPYFFLGQTGVVILLTLGLSPLLARGSRLINFGILAGSAVTIGLAAVLLPMGIRGFPFAFCLWLAAQIVLLGVISANAISDAFDIRTFKQVARWANAAGSIGGLSIGLSVPLILSVFGTESLLIVLALLMIISGACVFALKPLPAMGRRKRSKVKQTPLRYSLFLYIALAAILLTMINVFADYALKAEVGAAYGKAGVGKFMGPFYGICGALSLLLQLGGINVVLKTFGIIGLLIVLPAFCAIANIGVAVWPALWTAAAFRMGQTVFRYSFGNLGNQIVLNPLPSSVRRSGKLFLKSVATPLGSGLAAVALMVIAHRTGLRGIAVMTLFISGALIFIVFKIAKAYQSTLLEAVKTKRFGESADDFGVSTQESAQNIVINALKAKDPDATQFAFTLLEDVIKDRLPDEAFRHLDSTFADIRVAVARSAGRLNDKEAVPHLVARLDREIHPEVRWHLLEALSTLDPEAALPKANRLIDNSLPDVRAGAILVLIAAGGLDEILKAGTVLKEMMHSDDPLQRKAAARALGVIRTGKLDKELQALINDPDNDVEVTAIRSAGARCATGLSPALVAKLGRGRESYYAARALVELGISVVPHLKESIQTGKSISARTAIRTLSLVPGDETDTAMIEIAQAGDVLTRSLMAKETALRAKRHPIGAALRQYARQSAIADANAVELFRAALGNDRLSDYVGEEVRARQKMAETRMLYWFAACTSAADVTNFIPTIVPTGPTEPDALRRATALETLEALAADRELKKIVQAFDGPLALDSADATERLRTIDDEWIHRILATPDHALKGKTMDITRKILVLRKVNLFRDLPGEIVLAIAEECEARDVSKDEKIFSENDESDGLFVIADGLVDIVKGGQTLVGLREYDFFGELGALFEEPRKTDAVARSDGMLLYLDKDTFESITEDLPEVLKAVIKTVIGYLKQSG